MRRFLGLALVGGLLAAAPAARAQQPGDDVAEVEVTACIQCHGTEALWEGERRHLFVTPEHLEGDVHWGKGIRCHDCHGGDPTSTNFIEVHAAENGFRPLKSPADVPEFCGHCHSNTEYMTRFQPSPSTNQLADYWTSGHGKRLKEHDDTKVATCISCHGGHEIRRKDDVQSPVYPTNVAKTCAKCHADAELMAGREAHGRPLGHDQYALWSKSVHAEMLLEKGDLSAATCNDCHSNHSTVVPEPAAVANACGKCHVKIAELFNQTRMKHGLEEVGLPGCATCHGAHEIRHPSDEMLGMQAGAVCAKCHEKGRFGATLAGKQEARKMRAGLEGLKTAIADAETRIAEAKRLGMEVRGPHFDLRQARQSLIHARTLVHAFGFEPMNEAIQEGLETTDHVEARAQQALDEYTNRRIWLAVSLVPIFVVVVVLLAYIRRLPLPSSQQQAAH